MNETSMKRTSSLIGLVPKMFHRVIHFLHFQAVVLHDSTLAGSATDFITVNNHLLVQRLSVLFQVGVSHIRYLAYRLANVNKAMLIEPITLTLIN